MLKLEIKLYDNKNNKDQKYSVSGIYQTLSKVFDIYQLRKEYEPDGTVIFYGSLLILEVVRNSRDTDQMLLN